MYWLSHIARISGLLAVLLTVSSSHAEINHTNKDLRSSSDNQTKENSIIEPSVQPGSMANVAYFGGSNLKFGVDIDDHSNDGQLLQISPDSSSDKVELKAGFTYMNPTNNKAKFYMNYSMLGGDEHAAVLQDKSSEQAYYIDQQAKVGVKIAF